MLLTSMPPLPRVGPKRAAEVLRSQEEALRNLSGAGGDADSRLSNYHRWTTEATRMLFFGLRPGTSRTVGDDSPTRRSSRSTDRI